MLLFYFTKDRANWHQKNAKGTQGKEIHVYFCVFDNLYLGVLNWRQRRKHKNHLSSVKGSRQQKSRGIVLERKCYPNYLHIIFKRSPRGWTAILVQSLKFNYLATVLFWGFPELDHDGKWLDSAEVYFNWKYEKVSCQIITKMMKILTVQSIEKTTNID